jgi:hypothetical protein
MALLEFNRNPSPRDLRWFGLVLAAALCTLGGIAYWRTRSTPVAAGIAGAGVLIGVAYYAVRPARRPIFLAWGGLTYPLGLALSFVVLSVIYFLVITPVGLIMRLVGRDPMCRRFDRAAATYWRPRPPARDPQSYFSQF